MALTKEKLQARLKEYEESFQRAQAQTNALAGAIEATKQSLADLEAEDKSDVPAEV